MFAMYGPEFTFLGVPRADLDDPASLEGADVVVVGAPFDGGTSNRPGARFGPSAIRGTDYLGHDGSRPSLALGVDALRDLHVVDVGDVIMLAGEIEPALERLERAVHTVAAAGAVPVVLGGDHTIALPDVTGVARHHGMGRVSVVHFDAHADTSDTQFGSLLGHGTPMRRLIEYGAVPGDRFVQVGLRGYWPPAETFAWMKEQGMVWHTMHEIWERGFKTVMADAVAEALDKADHLYVSVDVDVMDPAHAPGTGTPEPGGMTSVDLLRMVRQLALEHDLVGMDVVEVAPAYDVSDLTVNAAHRLVFEALAGMAERRRRAGEGA